MATRIIKQIYGKPRHQLSIIMDRDGTINFDEGYLFDPRKLELIPDAINFFEAIVPIGVDFYIATNQGGVALGKYTSSQMKIFNDELIKILIQMGVNVVACYSCPHHPDGLRIVDKFCSCRKPKPGLYRSLIADFTLRTEKVYVVGNSLRDIEAGMRLDLPGFLVNDSDSWTQARKRILTA